MKKTITGGTLFMLGSLLMNTAAAEEAGGFLKTVENVNNTVNGVVWGVPALALLAFVGILMTVLTKVFQVSHLGHWFRKTIGAVFRDKLGDYLTDATWRLTLD